MVLIALVIVAGVLLVVGVLQSAWGWLVGSLVASVAAAVLLYRSRPADPDPQRAESLVADPDAPVQIVPGRGRYHRVGCELLADGQSQSVSRGAARRDGLVACSLCEPDAVEAVGP